MFAPGHDLLVALAHARKAARRGDVARAERWLKLAERHAALAERLDALAEAEARARTRAAFAAVMAPGRAARPHGAMDAADHLD